MKFFSQLILSALVLLAPCTFTRAEGQNEQNKHTKNSLSLKKIVGYGVAAAGCAAAIGQLKFIQLAGWWPKNDPNKNDAYRDHMDFVSWYASVGALLYTSYKCANLTDKKTEKPVSTDSSNGAKSFMAGIGKYTLAGTQIASAGLLGIVLKRWYDDRERFLKENPEMRYYALAKAAGIAALLYTTYDLGRSGTKSFKRAFGKA